MTFNALRSRSVVVVAAAMVGLSSWVDTARAADSVADPVASVNIFQGTTGPVRYSRGSCLPLVSEPWALTDWAIQTNGDAGEGRFFDPASHRFAGIRGTHQPSRGTATTAR